MIENVIIYYGNNQRYAQISHMKLLQHFYNDKNWKSPKCLPAGNWLSTFGFIHLTGMYVIIKSALRAPRKGSDVLAGLQKSPLQFVKLF